LVFLFCAHVTELRGGKNSIGPFSELLWIDEHFTKKKIFEDRRFLENGLSEPSKKIIGNFQLKNQKYETHTDTQKKKTQVAANPRKDAMVMWKRPISDPHFTCIEM